MTQRDTPPQAGLTRNPHETGVIHDAYSTEGSVWYVTRDELAAIEARARRRGHQAPVDLDEMRDTIRARKGKSPRTLVRARRVS